MAYVMVDTFFNMFNVFCSDSLGQVIVYICVFGVCVALFRVLRRGAGG